MDPLTGFGLTLSLLSWLRSEASGRDLKTYLEECFDDIEARGKLVNWLSRNRHEEIVALVDESRKELLEELASVGPVVESFADKLLVEIRLNHSNLLQKISELNLAIQIPVLSPNPLENRSMFNVPLLGRDEDYAKISNATTDLIVHGQPGIGKTYLLRELATTGKAMFLLSSDADRAVEAISANPPECVIIDDAYDKQELLSRLLAERRARSLPFRIIAVCWPFEWEELAVLLSLSGEQCFELSLLEQDHIIEIIKLVASQYERVVNDAFLKVVISQARGKVGLAVSLTHQTIIDDAPAELDSGALLLRNVEAVVNKWIGRSSLHVIAAYSVGGVEGMPTAVVARALGMPIPDVTEIVRRLAPSGIMQQMVNGRLAVVPERLRAIAVSRAFFSETPESLGHVCYEEILRDSPDAVQSIQTLCMAVARCSAVISDDDLIRIVAPERDVDMLIHLASTRKSLCQWVLDNYPSSASTIKDVALHYTPEKVLPMLLAYEATLEPTNIAHEWEIQTLKKWIQSAEGGDAVERRKLLHQVAVNWLKEGGDSYVALLAFRLAMDLSYEDSESKPGSSGAFVIKSGGLSFAHCQALYELWAMTLSSLKGVDPILINKEIRPLIQLWRCGGKRFHGEISDDHQSFLDDTAKAMCRDLIEYAKDFQPLLRWIWKEMGRPDDLVPVSRDYLIFYPIEELHDYKAAMKENLANAKSLALRWSKDSPHDIISRIEEIERQASNELRAYPRMTPNVCAVLAEHISTSFDEFKELSSVLRPDCVEPFVKWIIRNQGFTIGHLDILLKTPEHARIPVELYLNGELSEFSQAIHPLLDDYSSSIGMSARSGCIEMPLLKSLLNHEAPAVCLETALGHFRAQSSVDESLSGDWRDAIIRGLSDKDVEKQDVYDLNKILSYDPSMACDILTNRICAGNTDTVYSFSSDNFYPELCKVLNKDERQRVISILDQIEYLGMSDLPHMIVGDNSEVYDGLLSDQKAKDAHLVPLQGMPNRDGWIDLALTALKHGISPETIAHSATHEKVSLGSLHERWTELKNAFQELTEKPNPHIQEIARIGFEKASEQSEHWREKHHKRRVYGF